MKSTPGDWSERPGMSSQSYDLTCNVPYNSLLSTVIPGWLWSGMTEEGGMQNIPSCQGFQHNASQTTYNYIWISNKYVCPNSSKN